MIFKQLNDLLFAVLVVTGVMLLSSLQKSNAAEAELEFNYFPIGHVRSDPIINNVCLSDHIHSFYGPPLVDPSVDTEDLLKTDPSEHSGLVEENKSLYWHPSIYKVSADGVYTLDEVYYVSVYYFWDTKGKTFAFPNGFRMIAQDREAFTECVVGDWKPCTRTDGCTVPNNVKTFFPQKACDMLEITMDFPSCWDGRIDSPNHRDHVKYSNEDDDSCKAPHDKRIPKLSISIYIKNYDGGYHTWSDLSDKFHTDYLSGWDVDLMERFLKGCKKNTDNCDRFLTYKSGPTGCDSHDEKHRKVVDALPPLPDTVSTIADEPVTNFKFLPRGECLGPFTDIEVFPDDDTPTSAPNNNDNNNDGDGDDESNDNDNDSSCTDDQSLKYKNKDTLNCNWVNAKPGKRCDLKWKNRELKEFCPESCNACDDENENNNGNGDGGGGDDDDDDGNVPSCTDDESLQYKKKKSQDCNWVRANAGKRCNLKWKKRKLKEFCPMSCNECDGGDDDDDDNDEGVCKDDSNFYLNEDKSKDCKWVGKNPANRCNKTWKSRKIKEYCPETCDECE